MKDKAPRPSGIRGDSKLDKNSKQSQREIDAFTKYYTENPEAKPQRTLHQRRVDGLGVGDYDRAEESGYAAAKKKYANGGLSGLENAAMRSGRAMPATGPSRAFKKGGKVRGCGVATKGFTKGRMV